MWWFCLSLLVLSSVADGLQLGAPIVTKQGLIRGQIEDGYSLYLGIPFGRVNNSNPFGIAQPYDKFETVYHATEDSPACPQILNGRPIGDLDCLRLNIFVPDDVGDRSYPVIVWLFGGTFTHGYTALSNYNPRSFVKHGIIVVTVNYRVGPYGFMCLDLPEVAGNQGLKDQKMAMRWVRDNIDSFKGDVNRITLMGQSSGAASVEVHLLSKNEKLFNKIVLQSGSIFKPGNIRKSDPSIPLRIGEKLGLKADKNSEALIFLANAHTDSVVNAMKDLHIKLGICVEKKFAGVESVVTESPYVLKPTLDGMDVMAGFNSREGLVMNAINPNEFINDTNYFHDNLNNIFDYSEDFVAMAEIVKHFYTGDEPMTEQVRESIIDFQSDFFYNYPLQFTLRRFLKNGANNIYQYMFSYVGSLNYIRNIRHVELEGACHGDELGYLFYLDRNEREPMSQDRVIMDRLGILWANFAKYGNPLPNATDLLPVHWHPITENAIPYLNIDSEVTMKSRPLQKRLAFWELFFTANRQRIKLFGQD